MSRFLFLFMCLSFSLCSAATQSSFNPATVATFSGRITDVKVVSRFEGKIEGIHLKFESNGQTYDVLAGPKSYLDSIGLYLKQNQTAFISGSLINKAGEQVLIPISINVEGKTYTLRDSKGIPAWRGQSADSNAE